jgi:hypothetical protein
MKSLAILLTQHQGGSGDGGFREDDAVKTARFFSSNPRNT